MDVNSILNGISIGKDTSGNFRMSIEGLAVRAGTEGGYSCLSKDLKLLDVSGLTLENTEAYI